MASGLGLELKDFLGQAAKQFAAVRKQNTRHGIGRAPYTEFFVEIGEI